MPVPPITIGELNNVPTPLSDIKSNWAQDATARVVHRFASVGAMAASNLTDGALATVGGIYYGRVAGVWTEFAFGANAWTTGWAPAVTGFPGATAPTAAGRHKRSNTTVDFGVLITCAASTSPADTWGPSASVPLPQAAADTLGTVEARGRDSVNGGLVDFFVFYESTMNVRLLARAANGSTVAPTAAIPLDTTHGITVQVAGRYRV